MSEEPRNRYVCPRCGEVRLETPEGTSILPTLGMARKTAMARQDAGDGEWSCDCGRQHPPGEAAAD